MSTHNPDPEENVTGLEPGGGVPPGETPPAESSSPAPEAGRDEYPDNTRQGVWLVGLGTVIIAVIVAAIVGRILGIF